LYAFIISPMRATCPSTHLFHKFSAIHSHDVVFCQRRSSRSSLLSFHDSSRNGKQMTKKHFAIGRSLNRIPEATFSQLRLVSQDTYCSRRT